MRGEWQRNGGQYHCQTKTSPPLEPLKVYKCQDQKPQDRIQIGQVYLANKISSAKAENFFQSLESITQSNISNVETLGGQTKLDAPPKSSEEVGRYQTSVVTSPAKDFWTVDISSHKAKPKPWNAPTYQTRPYSPLFLYKRGLYGADSTSGL